MSIREKSHHNSTLGHTAAAVKSEFVGFVIWLGWFRTNNPVFHRALHNSLRVACRRWMTISETRFISS